MLIYDSGTRPRNRGLLSHTRQKAPPSGNVLLPLHNDPSLIADYFRDSYFHPPTRPQAGDHVVAAKPGLIHQARLLANQYKPIIIKRTLISFLIFLLIFM